MLEIGVPFLTGFFLFLFGILSLSNDLQKFIGSRASDYLRKATSNVWLGALFGAVATALIQSSSATTTIVVGLVDAGLLSFMQSLGVIIGANIGTTITAQFIAFKATALAPLLISAGFMLSHFSKGKKRFVGKAVFSLGILFLGLEMMGSAMAPLGTDPFFMSHLAMLNNPFAALFAAMLFTAVVQSSSVTTSLIVLMGMQGLVGINAAIPMILGAGIGTTITVLFASMKLGRSSKRVAVSHLLFNVCGVVAMLPFIPQFAMLMVAIGGNPANQIANAHTLFNVFTGVSALILIKPFAGLVMRIVPMGGEEELHVSHQLESAGTDPLVVFGLAEKELVRQGRIALRMLNTAYLSLVGMDDSKARSLGRNESVVNHLQKEITTAMVGVSRSELSGYDARRVAAYSRITNEIERVADLSLVFEEAMQHMMYEGAKFSGSALNELDRLKELSFESFRKSCALIEDYSREGADEIFAMEEAADSMVPRLHSSHIRRVRKGGCSIVASQEFSDVVSTLERISDHSKNIAQQLMELDKAGPEGLI